MLSNIAVLRGDVPAAEEWLEQVLDELCGRAEGAVREGVNIIILSDRMAGSDRIPIHIPERRKGI